MAAYADLMSFLNEGEQVEAIVFGPWGWSSAPPEGQPWEHGFGEHGEPDIIGEPPTAPPPVPFEVRGRPLTIEQAEPYMNGWSFRGGYGRAECYAIWAWTNRRVIAVSTYDGATSLFAVPRNPCEGMPTMAGS